MATFRFGGVCSAGNNIGGGLSLQQCRGPDWAKANESFQKAVGRTNNRGYQRAQTGVVQGLQWHLSE